MVIANTARTIFVVLLFLVVAYLVRYYRYWPNRRLTVVGHLTWIINNLLLYIAWLVLIYSSNPNPPWETLIIWAIFARAHIAFVVLLDIRHRINLRAKRSRPGDH